MSTAAIVGGSLAAAGISAGASLSAAGTQASAAESAAQLQAQEQQNALDFQKQEWQTQQANEAPFLKAGTGAVNTLSQLTAVPGQGLLTPYSSTFTAPTLAQAEQEPGYQFSLQQGELALQNQAAATGNVFSGSTLNAADQYAQNLAQNNYQNVYNRALQTYNTNYNVWAQNQANQYNRLANLAGFGQTTAGQLGQQGQAAASNTGNIFMTGGQQIGQDIQNAAAAQASGYVGAANAFGSGVNSLSQYALLNSLLGGGGANYASTYLPSSSIMQPSYIYGSPTDVPPPSIPGVTG